MLDRLVSIGCKWFVAGTMAVTAISALQGVPGAAAQTPKEGVFFECSMRETKRNRFWISSAIGIVVLEAGKVVITDGVTLAYGRSVVAGQITRDTASDLHVIWTVQGGLQKDREVLVPTVDYSAKLSKDTMRVRVSARHRGARHQIRGRGTCVARRR